MPRKKAAHDAYGVKRKTPPQEARDRGEQVGQRREMIKDRMQMMRLQLALLQQVHHAPDASERESAIGHEGHGCVKFKPGISREGYWVSNVDGCDQSKTLQQQH